MVRRGRLPLPLSFMCLLCFSTNLTVLGEGPECSTADGHGPQDMIQNGVMNQKYMWYKRGHKTYVPVVMDHSYTYKEHSIIVGGLHEIQQKTCVEFDIYDNENEVEEKDYVHITKNTKRGCYSYIGRIGGKQEIGLPVGCISHRTAMHEMLHALGFRHEHVRYDRDEYIIVFWGNIRRGRESNFKKRSPSDLVSGPYDYESIMHYEKKAFSNNGMDTIRPLKPGTQIGVRQKMSHWDAQKVNIVYKCGGSYSNSDGGDLDSHLLSYSPALRHNEDFDRNETLPVAEFDDFNSQGQGQARSVDPHSHLENPDEEDDPDTGGINSFNEIPSFSNDLYDNNNNNHHNHDHNRHLDRGTDSESDRGTGGPHSDDDGGGGSSGEYIRNNNENNGGPFYTDDDDIYDF